MKTAFKFSYDILYNSRRQWSPLDLKHILALWTMNCLRSEYIEEGVTLKKSKKPKTKKPKVVRVLCFPGMPITVAEQLCNEPGREHLEKTNKSFLASELVVF